MRRLWYALVARRRWLAARWLFLYCQWTSDWGWGLTPVEVRALVRRHPPVDQWELRRKR